MFTSYKQFPATHFSCECARVRVCVGGCARACVYVCVRVRLFQRSSEMAPPYETLAVREDDVLLPLLTWQFRFIVVCAQIPPFVFEQFPRESNHISWNFFYVRWRYQLASLKLYCQSYLAAR